jgi:hypothetical protein
MFAHHKSHKKMNISILKKVILILSILGLIAFLSSCTKQPEACINVSKQNAGIGESISFSSCSENADKVIWSFGDGSADVEGNDVTKSYSSPGNYLVELRTFSKREKKWDRASVLVKVEGVKKRFLKKITIESFPPLKPDLSTWDALINTDPDIFIRLRIDSSNFVFNTSTFADAKLNQLPLVWDYSPLRILLTNNDWIIQMRDEDLTGSELMAEFSTNLANTDASSGIISLASQNAIIKIEFSEE